MHGFPMEMFFTQIHHPCRLGASDIIGARTWKCPLPVNGSNICSATSYLEYPNWEWSRDDRFSESFETLMEGLQQAFFELGGVPVRHRSDRMSATVKQALIEGIVSDFGQTSGQIDRCH